MIRLLTTITSIPVDVTVCSPNYDRIYLQCKKCGKVKCKKMK